MRFAILTDTDRVFVEFPEPTFRELLKKYLADNENNVDVAFDHIKEDLRQLTITV